METKSRIKVALLMASLAAVSVFLAAQYRRRRKEGRRRLPCYLHSEQKPQHSFKRVLADNSYSPFKHSYLNEDSVNSHPYESEISGLIENPKFEFEFDIGDADLVMREEYVWVETEAHLKELVDVLSKERAFGVDTEQHSLRSFLGFTCLIQISTTREDYLVDTIALHDVMGILRPVFADPSICKVFHGADNDVIWLQRDFHIYVVNLFDTAKACEVLSKPQKSLAYLLQTYCDVATNKVLQREDWRQRPLSVEMVEYARTDAHYLLFIANCLIAEIKQQDNENSSCPDDKLNFVLETSRRSNMICMQLYTKEVEAPPGFSAASSLLSRHANGQGGISSVSCQTQFDDLVRRLCAWRDVMARLHDESLRYVLSDQAIIALADKVPMATSEICSVIAEADLNMDSSSSSFISSPSSVVCSHLDDFYYLWQDSIHNPNDILPIILQKHLSGNGSCPLSVFNYSLLVNCNQKLTNKVVPKQNGHRHSRQLAKKSSRELFVQKFSCKSPVYDNCRIYADDGRLLCYCDRRKLEWYLRRNLAKLVDEDPLAIMLLFEPKGRPEDEDNDFYIQSKKNICVGCGEKNHYLRYRVIPSCYRVHFPEHLKSHRSHDIVLLCVDCHEIAHTAAEKYKKQIAKEFGIPLFIRKVVDSGQPQVISGSSESANNIEEAGVSPLQLRIAAMALLRHGPRMPSKRRELLTQTVMRYYGGREITEEDLERALLVGMSPQEKRRLEKKKGLSFKHLTENGKEQESKSGSATETVIADTSKVESSGDSHPPPAVAPFNKIEDEDSYAVSDNGTDKPSLSSYTETTTVYENMESDKSACVCNGNTDDNCESKNRPNGSVDLTYRYDGDAPPKHSSKLSLLGHGPHGKLVVDHLLNEYGDDGVSQFCQRWRQVFVESLHPRFLPGGWDVLHSGKREFGEFSVYNPSKKDESKSK